MSQYMHTLSCYAFHIKIPFKNGVIAPEGLLSKDLSDLQQ